ncbi:Outer membrane protein OmpA [Cognatiyoonia koreensis]|uniref:Outer membrane protein OmpA n=1 Tax=Cognatiyoonia koreensis TaxID=364200 RepID=A0A1I0QX15_9RHOB|nr:OmpA family protein [Cognatiyoonia koreensis]SEW32336.1 Outer membrane protein OmpA [Cognatiyoonia koreensis]
MRIGLIVGIFALTGLVFFSAVQSFAKSDGPDVFAQVTALTAQFEEDRIAFEEESAALNAQLEVLRTERDELVDASTLVEEKIAVAQAAFADSETKLQGVAAELDETLALAETLESENAELQVALIAAKEQSEAMKDDVTIALEAEIASLQGAIDEKAAALVSADARISELSQEITQKEQLQSELDQLSTELATSKAELDTRDAKIAELQTLANQPAVTPESVCQQKSDSLLADGSIDFEPGTTTLAANAMPLLESIAATAISCSHVDVRLEIEGHTHSGGGLASNLLLSNGRAMAVYDALLELGVPSNAMRAVGYGDSDPIADNASEDGRQLNQRIALDWEQK